MCIYNKTDSMPFTIPILLFGTAFGPEAAPLIAIAFVLSFGITALLYMFGNAFQSQDILGMAKDCLANVIFSAIIVLMFFAFFLLFNTIASAIICGTPDCDFLKVAYNSIIILRTKMVSLYMELYYYELFIGLFSTMGFSVPLSALDPTGGIFRMSMPTLSLSPFAGLTPLSNAHTIVVEAVGSAMLLVFGRQVFLEFIMNYMYIFFILGACLRSFTFTRKTGSSLLALAAVCYFVYPSAVILTNHLIFHEYKPTNFGIVPTAVGYCDDPKTIETLANRFTSSSKELYTAEPTKQTSKWYSFWNFLVEGTKYHLHTIWNLAKILGTFNLGYLKHLIFTVPAFTTLFDFLIIEIQILVQFVVLVFTCFVLEIILVISMYRNLAMVIEGETEIFGINKLI